MRLLRQSKKLMDQTTMISYKTSIPKFERLWSWPPSSTDLRNSASKDIDRIYAAIIRLSKTVTCYNAQVNDSTDYDERDSPRTTKTKVAENWNRDSCLSNLSPYQDCVKLKEIKTNLTNVEHKITTDKFQKNISSKVVNFFMKTAGKEKVPFQGMKTKSGLSNFLEFLFFLQWIPEQVYDVVPMSLGSYFENVTSGNTVDLSESMSNTLLRLSSFSTFPRHIDIFSSRFSNAGFYFTGVSDTVKCYSCGISHSGWNSGDNPLEIHQRLNPNCSHLRNLHDNSVQNGYSLLNSASLENNQTSELNISSDNNSNRICDTVTTNYNSNPEVSRGIGHAQSCSTGSDVQNIINSSTSSVNTATVANNLLTSVGASDVPSDNVMIPVVGSNSNSSVGICRNIQNNSNDRPSIGHNTNNGSSLTTHPNGASNNVDNEEDIPNLGIVLDKPKYPNYAPMQVRISSYQNWPGYLDQTPKVMATAGFLYAGYNDYTRCFFCGGGLRNWEAGDDPWVEHARWFPKCAYLLQNKGAKFIRVVQEKHQRVMAEQNNRTNLASPALSTPDEHPTAANKAVSAPLDPLNTPAARSVLQMGYTGEQVLKAMDRLKALKKDSDTVSATEIMTILLEENVDENSSNVEHNTGGHARVNTTSLQTTGVNSTNAPNEYNTENSNGATTEGATKPSTNDGLAAALNDTELLLEENRQLRDQRLCKVCLDLEASIAFLPCGHLVCCADCAPAMRKCPICRARVKGTVKTFLI